ncbi:MAG: 2-amino-4-hydroxy-6-hydroxymethyldihydropteridine diphosphokinase [Treponema sp.]|jgi:2-amino-4-hydroxy-6-hydroxymethyldihydropteridine diphosphokinase|nr:2-amino-4-hydroxy-6-hydroxymethyldihydropteridine diphosphokinase [Treponema sp.]
MERAVLGLGSNRPFGAMSPKDLVSAALQDLGAVLSDIRVSGLYTSAALHLTRQAAFINAACCGFYSGSPEALLAETQDIEARYGRMREREERWGPRTLDIDLLLFGSRIVSLPHLCIPHPRLKERRFALQPLAELLPLARDPESGALYGGLLEQLQDQQVEPLADRLN